MKVKTQPIQPAMVAGVGGRRGGGEGDKTAEAALVGADVKELGKAVSPRARDGAKFGMMRVDSGSGLEHGKLRLSHLCNSPTRVDYRRPGHSG